jgi:hypothetical protein
MPLTGKPNADPATGWTGHPLLDPSALTTQQILREVHSLEKLTSQRMDAIEKAVEVAHDDLVRVPTEVQKAVGNLNELMLEKFETTEVKFQRIQTQFEERDLRAEHTARDAKIAVDAALAAQEKQQNKQTESFSLSIAKSEAATAKQIDQQGQLLVTATKALSDKIDDVKDRLTRIEGEGRGLKAAETTQQTSNMSVVSIVGLVVGTLIGIAGIVVAVMSRTP